MLEASNRILRQSFKTSSFSDEDIVDRAATLINDEIRSTEYDLTRYPKTLNMTNDTLTKPLTKRFFDLAIEIKSKVIPQAVERKRISISHALINAVRPRSFISPVLLSIAVYLNAKLESREGVDILSSLSFCEDYKELLRLYDSLIPDNDTEEFSCTFIDYHGLLLVHI